MTELQQFADGAYALRWPLVVFAGLVAGCVIAILVGDRNHLEQENAELREEIADLKAKRPRVIALRPKNGGRHG